MKYVIDHDYHIHSRLSICSANEKQTPERILQYAKDNNFKKIVLTDHYFDSAVGVPNEFYKDQSDKYKKALPLPKSQDIEFLFGAEIDMDKNCNIGLAPDRYDEFDFVIIPTTHFHMMLSEQDCESAVTRANAWIKRFEKVLNSNLPFHKIGLAHLSCGLIAPAHEEFLEVLDLIPTEKMEELFGIAAEKGVGIELNIPIKHLNCPTEELERIMRMYKIAKKQGCKFYLGSDAHHPEELDGAIERFSKIIDILDLTEEDKFHIGK